MKKITKIIFLLIISISLFLCGKDSVYAASASLTGSTTVKAGDTITLKLNISGNDIIGLEGALNYDSSQVTLSDMSCDMSGWEVESNGNSITVYDNTISNLINGTKAVLTLEFKVNSNITTGTTVKISVNNLVVTDINERSNLGTASYSASITAPLSTNANLSSLSVTEGALSPSFSADTTSYSIGEVDYSVSKLNISCETEDGKATVSINGNNLSVGENTVSIVVKAENGDTKTYKIQVTRKQDSNYVPSSNAALDEITVSNGTLSPAFSSEATDYIVYLPYEYAGKEFTVTGNAIDEKAQGVTDGTISSLVEGVNSTTVICKAEDGTEKQYKITVVVMPQYNGAVPNVEGVETEIDDTEVEDIGFEPSTDSDLTDDSKDNGNRLTGGIAIVVIIILIGALIYVLFFLNKRNRM